MIINNVCSCYYYSWTISFHVSIDVNQLQSINRFVVQLIRNAYIPNLECCSRNLNSQIKARLYCEKIYFHWRWQHDKYMVMLDNVEYDRRCVCVCVCIHKLIHLIVQKEYVYNRWLPCGAFVLSTVALTRCTTKSTIKLIEIRR
jgi:hypothetical protein